MWQLMYHVRTVQALFCLNIFALKYWSYMWFHFQRFLTMLCVLCVWLVMMKWLMLILVLWICDCKGYHVFVCGVCKCGYVYVCVVFFTSDVNSCTFSLLVYICVCHFREHRTKNCPISCFMICLCFVIYKVLTFLYYHKELKANGNNFPLNVA